MQNDLFPIYVHWESETENLSALMPQMKKSQGFGGGG